MDLRQIAPGVNGSGNVGLAVIVLCRVTTGYPGPAEGKGLGASTPPPPSTTFLKMKEL